MCIHLQEFSLRSTLNAEEYGPQESAITAEHIESQLEGLTVAEVHFLNALWARNVEVSDSLA